MKTVMSKTTSNRTKKVNLPPLQHLSNDIELAKLLIKAQAEYIDLLHSELDELVPFASPRGWQSSRYLTGLAHRANIENINLLLTPPDKDKVSKGGLK
jgi:hypothetical protein